MINADLIISSFTLALAALVYFVTRELSPLGGIFVNYVLIAMGVLSLILLVKAFVKPERVKMFESAIERNNVLTGVVFLGAYLFVLPLVGFLPSSYVFYFCFNLYLSDEKNTKTILQSAFITAVVVTAFYFIFHNFLEVPLPEGSWFESE